MLLALDAGGLEESSRGGNGERAQACESLRHSPPVVHRLEKYVSVSAHVSVARASRVLPVPGQDKRMQGYAETEGLRVLA